MTEDTPKTKKKKISLSAQIKKLKDRIKELEIYNQEAWDKYHELNREIDDLSGIINRKYYLINFKIKANSGEEFSYNETYEAYSLQSAIRKLKKNKTHPDTFKLIDLKIFGD
jgi:chromosome segregation ATPase